MKALLRTGAVTVVGLLMIGESGSAQVGAPTGPEIFEEALDRYEARMASVQSYTVVQDFMGFESTIQWMPEDVEGRRVFGPLRSRTLGDPGEIGGDGVDHLGNSSWDDPFRYFLEWGQAAVFEERVVLGGEPAYVVRVDDFGGANFGLTPGTFAEGHFEPGVGWFYFDPATYLLRRIEAEGQLLFAGRATEVSVRAEVRDYRAIQGMVHPFAVDLSITGIPSATSDAEQALARRQLNELQAQLDSLPEGQQSTLRRLLNEQIARLRGISEGQLNLTLRVLDLQVQTATPGR